MGTSRKFSITYVTSSEFKAKEIEVLAEHGRLADGTNIGDLFEFYIRPVPIKEVLEVDIATMVIAEVTKAYSVIRVPCIVEHAGLIFSDYADKSYPGGLTKAMWNALGDNFVNETGAKGRKAIAKAVIAYCDGMRVATFTGERQGTIAEAPRGTRAFYWDTVFIPDDPTGTTNDMTYAEIVDDPTLGLKYKVTALSQSSMAMVAFLEHLRSAPTPTLWRNL